MAVEQKGDNQLVNTANYLLGIELQVYLVCIEIILGRVNHLGENPVNPASQ